MISGSAQRNSTSWDMDSIIRAGGEDSRECKRDKDWALSLRLLGMISFHLLVNIRLKKWLAAASTTRWAGKCCPWTTRVTSQRVP